jgi:hypothetical protein
MIGVAGVVSSYAQNVYSVNVVGYISLKLTNQFSLIANQLDNGAGNLITNMFTAMPGGTVVYKFNGVAYDSLTFNAGPLGWQPPALRTMTLGPGDGAFVKKPTTASEINLTFVGEVLQGELVNPIAVGVDIYSTMVPQAGGLTSVHNYQPTPGDIVYRWDGVAYNSKNFRGAPFNSWNPAGEPTVNVGEAIFIKSGSAAVKNWTRTFNVN